MCDTYKVLILGSTFTGKTSIIRRFTSGEFITEHFSTPLPTCYSKKYKDKQGKYELSIWDTAGAESWVSMNKTAYHGVNAVVFVASFDSTDSLTDLTTFWLKRLHECISENDYISVLAINKSDIDESERSVNQSDINNMAETLNSDIILISAKEDQNIGELFELVREKARKRFGPKPTNAMNTMNGCC